MASRIQVVPRTVWTLGLVSLFMDISSEMIHSLLPVYLVVGLGASPALLGVIEGISEATASITKIFSGWLSDRLGRRKLLAVLGYALGAASKPVFPLAATPFQVLAARFVDRIGKGIRGAPRDALVADITPPQLRGAAFGLRQALDTVGAFTGPLLAVGLMLLLRGDMRAVFAWAVIPAVISVLLLALGVEEPQGTPPVPGSARAPIQWSQARGMGAPFWRVVGVGVLVTLARLSEAFLVLRGRDAGIPLTYIPFVLIAMNLVYALVSAPAGGLSDRLGRRGLLAFGLIVLMASEVVLALGGGLAGVVVGVGLWGLHMGCTQGLLAAMVADTAPPDLKGTAFGLFNLASGLAMLAAGVLAGALWSDFGAPFTFLGGAGLALASLLGVLALPREPPRA